MSMEQRVSRLEARMDALGTPATKADILDLSRDIANLAKGVGTDLRAIREDVAGLRQDVAEIRRLLERRRFWLF